MRQTAIVLSDCQGPTISWVLGQLPALQLQYDFSYFESWNKDGPLASVPPELLARCRLLFYQVTETTSADAVSSGLPRDCQVIRFGSPRMGAIYPRRGRWPRVAQGAPLHIEVADKAAIWLCKTGIGARDYLDSYYDRPIETDADMDALFALDTAYLEQFEAQIDIKTADYILTNFRTRKLFHCIDHPTNDLYFYQMGKMIDLCSRLGLHGFEDTAALKAGLLDVERNGPASFGATEFFGQIQAPVHPDVADIMGLTYCDADTVYANQGLGNWTHRDYIAMIHDYMATTMSASESLERRAA